METRVMPSAARREPYDPAYDPVHAASPGAGKDYAPTYWIGTAGSPPDDDGPITGDMDVAVIGSGYTSLSCAIHLAREHGIKATVIEANGVVGAAPRAMAGRRRCRPGG